MILIDYTTTIGTTDPLTLTVLDAAGPVDLTGATTAELRLRRSANDPLITVDLLASIDAGTGGTITHTWSGEVTEPGIYQAQLHIELAGGAVIKLPNTRVGGRVWYRYEFLPAL
jgi:hypothetical protein